MGPAEATRVRDRACAAKARLPTWADARRAAVDRGIGCYRCPFCRRYHLTSTTLDLGGMRRVALAVRVLAQRRPIGGVGA